MRGEKLAERSTATRRRRGQLIERGWKRWRARERRYKVAVRSSICCGTSEKQGDVRRVRRRCEAVGLDRKRGPQRGKERGKDRSEGEERKGGADARPVIGERQRKSGRRESDWGRDKSKARMRLPKHKLPKVKQAKSQQTVKHKKSEKKAERLAKKAERSESMELESVAGSVTYASEQEREAARLERKKSNAHRVMYKKTIKQITGKNGPRAVSR